MVEGREVFRVRREIDKRMERGVQDKKEKEIKGCKSINTKKRKHPRRPQ